MQVNICPPPKITILMVAFNFRLKVYVDGWFLQDKEVKFMVKINKCEDKL